MKNIQKNFLNNRDKFKNYSKIQSKVLVSHKKGFHSSIIRGSQNNFAIPQLSTMLQNAQNNPNFLGGAQQHNPLLWPVLFTWQPTLPNNLPSSPEISGIRESFPWLYTKDGQAIDLNKKVDSAFEAVEYIGNYLNTKFEGADVSKIEGKFSSLLQTVADNKSLTVGELYNEVNAIFKNTSALSLAADTLS